jgi:hypothetical protein
MAEQLPDDESIREEMFARFLESIRKSGANERPKFGDNLTDTELIDFLKRVGKIRSNNDSESTDLFEKGVDILARLTDESIVQQKSSKILLKAARFTQVLVLALISSNIMLSGIMFGLIWELLAK